MSTWTNYLLLIGLIFVALAIANRKDPQRVYNLGKLIVVFFVATSFWSMFDRIGTLGDTLGYSWLWILILLVLLGLAGYWIFILTKPSNKE